MIGVNEDKRPLVLGINCSQDKKGDSARNLKTVLKHIRKCGGKTKLIHAVDYDIYPRSTLPKKKRFRGHPFSVGPDVQILFRWLLRSDGLVISLPTHWQERSSPAQALIEHLNFFEIRGCLLGGRVGGVIVNYGLEEGGVGSRILQTLNDMGIEFPPNAVVRCSLISNFVNRLPRPVEACLVKIVEKVAQDELDGRTDRLCALGENVLLKIAMLRSFGADKPGFWK